jgi:hypothetical protein
MATDVRSIVLSLAIVALIVAGLYLIDPTFFGMRKVEGFQGLQDGGANYMQKAGLNENSGAVQLKATESNLYIAEPTGAEGPAAPMEEGFESGPADFGSATGPAGCYPRDQLTPGELLPKDQNSVWAQQNPMGTGSLKGKNFLSAGALIGVNTVGQSLRNANYQLRSEPPNPQVPVSVFNNSTIEPDTNRRDFEVS